MLAPHSELFSLVKIQKRASHHVPPGTQITEMHSCVRASHILSHTVLRAAVAAPEGLHPCQLHDRFIRDTCHLFALHKCIVQAVRSCKPAHNRYVVEASVCQRVARIVTCNWFHIIFQQVPNATVSRVAVECSILQHQKQHVSTTLVEQKCIACLLPHVSSQGNAPLWRVRYRQSP